MLAWSEWLPPLGGECSRPPVEEWRRNEPNEARSFSVFGPKNDYAELRISWLPIGQTDEGVTSAIAMLLFNLRIVSYPHLMRMKSRPKAFHGCTVYSACIVF